MATRPGPAQPTTSKRTDFELMKERTDKQAKDQGLSQTTMSKYATLGLTTERMDKQATRPGIDNGLLSKQVSVVNEGEKLMDKTLNLNVEIEGEDKVTMMELLNAVKDTCGRVLGCRFKGPNKYELTMSNPRGKERLLDGFKIKNSKVMAREVARDEMVMSFLNLPTYISDEEIMAKLTVWGVRATSPIKRRKWAGTDIFDGTRFCRVKFNESIQSLPYSTKFENLEGTEYFRVIHDNQVKVCRLCIQPGHILRECPDFKCHKCGKTGHYARECQESISLCAGCVKPKDKCVCAQNNTNDDAAYLSEYEEEEKEKNEMESEEESVMANL